MSEVDESKPDVNAGVTPEANPSVAENEAKAESEAEARLRKENERLKRALKSRNDELSAMKAPKPDAETVSQDELDELSTREGWFRLIEEKVEEKVKPIVEANRGKAVRDFLSLHPEYSDEGMRDKLDECLKAAQGKVERDDILETMSRHWAAQNYKEVERALLDRQRAKDSSRRLATSAGTVGEGVRNDDGYSSDEEAKAASYGMSVESYRKAKRQFDENHLGTL